MPDVVELVETRLPLPLSVFEEEKLAAGPVLVLVQPNAALALEHELVPGHWACAVFDERTPRATMVRNKFSFTIAPCFDGCILRIDRVACLVLPPPGCESRRFHRR